MPVPTSFPSNLCELPLLVIAAQVASAHISKDCFLHDEVSMLQVGSWLSKSSDITVEEQLDDIDRITHEQGWWSWQEPANTTWSMPQPKVWSDSQCGNLENQAAPLSECQELCEQSPQCNAINYDLSTYACVLRACPEPVPVPTWNQPGWNGYNLQPANMPNTSSVGASEEEAEIAAESETNTSNSSVNVTASETASEIAAENEIAANVSNTSNTSQVLFTSNCSSASFKDSWSGWYTNGSTTAIGDGKRGAYDSAALTGINFTDSSGRFAAYNLTPAFRGKTLLQIVTGCMKNDTSNTGSSLWSSGHCTNVGSVQNSSGLTTVSPLRIGVGDGQADALDWGLFMPVSGNAQGDFEGNHVWAFGSEAVANTGCEGMVMTIYGINER